MRRLRLPAKLGLLGTLLLVPIAALLGLEWMRAAQALDTARSQMIGAERVARHTELIAMLQRHRGLTNRLMSGDGAAAGPRKLVQDELRQSMKALDQDDEGATPFPLADLWAPLKETTSALLVETPSGPAANTFERHSQAIERHRRAIETLAERSGLLFATDPVAHVLMDTAVYRMVPWIETLARLRGQSSALLARGPLEPASRVALGVQLDQWQDRIEDMDHRAASMTQASRAQEEAWGAARQAAVAFSTRLRHIATADEADTTPAALFDLGTLAIQKALAFDSQLIARLQEHLRADEARLERAQVLRASFALAGLLLVTYVCLAFYGSYAGAIRQIARGVDAISEGNLAHPIHIRGRDELAAIGGTLEKMSQRLSSMVADIRSSAARVRMAGQEVADHGQSLAERTEAQASNLRQTMATIAQVSEAVATNAQAAQALDALTTRLRGQAELGGEAMRSTVASMGTLEDSSRRVAEIIGVIDSISFQTNILALNAAVEAARAGESGRGFAVVAAEVRQLAQRSGTAAAEIRALIAQSSSQVGDSVKRIHDVGGTLESVVSGVRDVADRLRVIAAASAQQSAGLEEIAQSVGNLDGITQENAQMVQQSAMASDDLVERAGALTEAVSTMRLRQGSADEARALVERAVELVRTQGWAAAERAFGDPAQGYVDRDLYVFAVDRDGRYLVHAARPQMLGHRIHEVPGIDGDRFIRDVWQAVQGGNGWVEYDIVNPESGKVQPKASYLVAVDDQRAIGCGVYRNGTTPTSAASQRKAPAATASGVVRGTEYFAT